MTHLFRSARRGCLPFVLILVLAAPAVAQPVITEFMAANKKTLADGDGEYSDWIELHNPGPVPVNLAGWFLTDDSKNLTKWQSPAVTIPAGGYFVVFASDKDRRDPAGELHTNFELDGDGEYLALVMPDGTTIVSQFAPKFPKQIDDVSYGVTQGFATGETPRNGHFRAATPGSRNGGTDSLVVLEKVTLSRASGPFTGTITLTMSGAAEGQRIRYVIAPPAASGAGVPEPTAAAAEYTGPITITSTTIVRATVFSADNLQSGFTASGHYVRLTTTGTSRIDTFASQLPLIVIDTHGSGPLEKDGVERPAWLYSWNRPTAGNTALTNPPTVASSLTTNVRGSSSADFPKKGFTIRLTDSNGKDDSVPLLGLPSFDTWVLVGPWAYDPTYLHNVIIYDLSNRMGRWAPRTQVAEAFLNTNGGDLDYSDYVGIYILTDALRVDSKRVDIASLSPKDLSGNAITGGYLMKFDVPDAVDFSFQTKRNYPGSPNALIVTSPKAEDLPQAQRDYIQGYVQSFEDALYADLASGWRQRTHLDFMDRDAWVDYHLLSTLSMNADGFIRSAYLMKDRRGRLVAGPVWDYDRALGGGDPRTLNPEVWAGGNGATEPWTYGWWGILVRDPEFMQAWIDRWQKLRKKEFSSANVSALLDGYAAQIGSAAPARDAARWPDNRSRFSGAWQGEVNNLKSFISRRSAWIDAMFNAPPTIANSNGMLTVTPAPGTRLAYTTDGTDPRALGGDVATTATVSSGPVTMANTLNLQARSYSASFNSNTIPGSPWSSAIGNPGRLVNLSILTELAAADTFTMGFVVGGAGTSGAKPLLSRAAGPSLAQLGVTAFLPDPTMSLNNTSSTPAVTVATNNDWSGTPALSTAFAAVGAFAYASPSSKDAAIFQSSLAPGNYTVQVNDTGTGTGTVIAELYDATPAATVGSTTPRLINVSVLKHLGTGLTAGFVVGGGSAKNVLIRAIGPTLKSAFGLSGEVDDPKLTLFDSSSAKIGDNDDWGGRKALADAFAAVGAFVLPSGSKDAALLATLAPGNYTVQVTGDKNNTGTALVEIYEVP